MKIFEDLEKKKSKPGEYKLMFVNELYAPPSRIGKSGYIRMENRKRTSPIVPSLEAIFR